MSKPIILALALALPAGAAASSLNFRVVDQNEEPLANAVVRVSGTALAARQAKTEPAIMDQRNLQFDPRVLVIQAGQAVAFPNTDQTRHHVYSFSKTKPFDLPLYGEDTPAPVVFDKAGVVTLGCNIHDHMVGFIVVSPNTPAGLTDEDGRLTVDIADEAEEVSVRVWHEALQDEQFVQAVQLGAPWPEDVVRVEITTKQAEAMSEDSDFEKKMEARFKRFKDDS